MGWPWERAYLTRPTLPFAAAEWRPRCGNSVVTLYLDSAPCIVREGIKAQTKVTSSRRTNNVGRRRAQIYDDGDDVGDHACNNKTDRRVVGVPETRTQEEINGQPVHRLFRYLCPKPCSKGRRVRLPKWRPLMWDQVESESDVGPHRHHISLLESTSKWRILH